MSQYGPAFDAAFEITIGHEGGYTNDPNDPGGETKYGISKAAYPNLDIANLTLDQAEQIYFNDYWSKAGCNSCAPALGILVFDAAVNNGLGNKDSPRTIAWLQSAVGVTADSDIGPLTLAAIAKADPQGSSTAFHAQRLAFMTQLKQWPMYGISQSGGPGGWSTRLAALPYQAAMAATQIQSSSQAPTS
jgi:lysozyme family protein